MLFGALKHFDSLRELEIGMKAEAHKLSHLGLDYLVRRSTLAEANIRRPQEFFAKVYSYLLEKYDIPFSNMVMHHETSYYGKLCPLPFSQKESDLKKWESFKKLVKKYMGKQENKKDDDVKTVTKVDKEDDSKVKSYVRGLQKSLNSLGEHLEVDGSYGSKTSQAMSRNNQKKGMKNDLVKHFQWWLKKAGIYKGEVDSSFGNQTLEAVKAAQKKVGVTADGIIGNGTAKAFMKLLG